MRLRETRIARVCGFVFVAALAYFALRRPDSIGRLIPADVEVHEYTDRGWPISGDYIRLVSFEASEEEFIEFCAGLGLEPLYPDDAVEWITRDMFRMIAIPNLPWWNPSDDISETFGELLVEFHRIAKREDGIVYVEEVKW